ncbi:putative pectinesterase/pectinesterase inhibitor 17 [Apostasia shenzhenica]|uniref:Pectinesterase n=1 Tax=Apostasia shenzhenica TaxID=1088818 RepID=A0A2I0B0I0_9ASPA|nr:putative pectinesterase/pectinesterase inhibitor 17 [Apostasia shenzhenica]
MASNYLISLAIFNGFLFVFLILISSTTAATANQTLSCSQTPYPELCSSMTATSSNSGNAQTSLRELSLRATLARAQLVHQLASTADLAGLDPPALAAWADCLELCQDTVVKLNRSLLPECSHEDSQTWLSATMANQHTCRNGFLELNSSAHLPSSPFYSHNITSAISNLLAINKAAAAAADTRGGGGRSRKLLSSEFPAWVSAADRRLLQSAGSVKADVVVAKDGSGNYKTIAEAVAAAKQRSGSSRFVIHVKAGVYNEYVEITVKNLMIVGDGMGSTIVTGNRNIVDGSTTFQSATFAVVGDGFIARDITFENTAGPQKQQAVALRSGSDLSVFYRCEIKGYQDTLYVYSQRQFYRNCDVYGTVDFIFGDAAVVLQNCNIYCLKPSSGQKNTVTAQGRSDPNENTGISVHNSVVAAAGDLAGVKSYLGRPWKQYSRTVFMKTSIGSLIDPAGWLEWSGDFALSTLYYGEYMNSGAGAATSGRVKWPGYHIITSASEAEKFTVGSFLSGDSWIPSTGVPYTSGL